MSENKAPELKPCPFCGSTNFVGGAEHWRTLTHKEGCWFWCMASMRTHIFEGEFERRWNTRADLFPATSEPSAEVRGPEDALHLAICDAVQLLNSCVHTKPEQFQARDILRQALLDYADADVGPRTKAIREAQRNPATDVTAIMVSPASHVDEEIIARIRKLWAGIPYAPPFKAAKHHLDIMLSAYDELRAQLANGRSAAIDECIRELTGLWGISNVQRHVAALEALKRDMRHGAALLTDAEVDAFLAEPIEPDPEQCKRVEQLFRRKMTDKADWEAK